MTAVNQMKAVLSYGMALHQDLGANGTPSECRLESGK
jgi:hypothetical protein